MKIFQSIIILVLLLNGCGDNNNKNYIEASGNIETKNVTVSARAAGEIIVINKHEGDFVKEGDTIIFIDNELLGLQYDQAEAARKIAEAQLALLRNGTRREDVQQAEQNFTQAEINYHSAKKDKDRLESLYKAGSITQKQYDDIVARYMISEAQLTSAKENLNKLKNFARPEELRQAEANLERQIAAVKILQKNINDSYIKAPTDGFLVNMFIEEGETVTQLSSLCKIADLSKVDLIIYVSEKELGRIKLGQTAEVTTDTYEDKIYKGEVTYISPEAEFTPKNIQTKDERTKLVFAVKIQIPNPQFELKSGMPADAVVYLD